MDKQEISAKSDLVEIVRGIASQIERMAAGIAKIEVLLSNPPIEKEWFSPKEVAEMTQKDGTIHYTYYTIREACNKGRIAGAKKATDSTRWLIPREALKQLLECGLGSGED